MKRQEKLTCKIKLINISKLESGIVVLNFNAWTSSNTTIRLKINLSLSCNLFLSKLVKLRKVFYFCKCPITQVTNLDQTAIF